VRARLRDRAERALIWMLCIGSNRRYEYRER
jgi:hypothetical protein